jgi:CRP-like cAMP-binding protein
MTAHDPTASRPEAPTARPSRRRLAEYPLFVGVPPAELNEIAARMQELQVEAGANVVTADDYTAALYLIEQGKADVLAIGGAALGALGPGDTFGEIGVVLTGQRTATVVARTPMRLLSLSGSDFFGIQGRVPEFERSLRRLGLERARRS